MTSLCTLQMIEYKSKWQEAQRDLQNQLSSAKKVILFFYLAHFILPSWLHHIPLKTYRFEGLFEVSFFFTRCR